MTEDEIYNSAYLDKIADYTEIRKEDVQAEQDFRAVERAEWAAQDAALNEILTGWVDERGRPVPGYEPIAVEGGDWKTPQGHKAMVQARKDFELGRISPEMHNAINAALKIPTKNGGQS